MLTPQFDGSSETVRLQPSLIPLTLLGLLRGRTCEVPASEYCSASYSESCSASDDSSGKDTHHSNRSHRSSNSAKVPPPPPADLRSCLQLGEMERPRSGDGNAWSVHSRFPIPCRADGAHRSAPHAFLQARTVPQHPPLSAPPALSTHPPAPLRRSFFVILAPTDGSEEWPGKGSPFCFLLPRILR